MEKLFTLVTSLAQDKTLDLSKDFLKQRIKDAQLSQLLNTYIEHQRKSNEFSTFAEEIDFDGLANALKGSMLESIRSYLLCPLPERSTIREDIFRAAEEFNIKKNGKARSIAQGALDICEDYYMKQIPDEAKYLANMMADKVKSDFHDELNKNQTQTQRVSQESMNQKQEHLAREVLKIALERQFARAEYYSLSLDPVETLLYPDIIEKNQDVKYFSTENQTALMEKLRDMENKLEPGNPVMPLLMTGEGGIGKTVTLLQTARELLDEGKFVIYVPLRRLTDEFSLDKFIQKEIIQDDTILPEQIWKALLNLAKGRFFYLFLDGFNEVQKNIKRKLASEIESLGTMGYVIVASSRRTFEEEGCTNSHYQRLCMDHLSWDKVCAYIMVS